MFTIVISEEGELESHQLIFIVVTGLLQAWPFLRSFASADPSAESLTWLLLCFAHGHCFSSSSELSTSYSPSLVIFS